jgi:hypothetical protein
MKGGNIMMEMRWTNWVGFLMLVILFMAHEPIWLFVFSDSANILWVIPVAIYAIVAAVLMIRGGPAGEET